MGWIFKSKLNLTFVVLRRLPDGPLLDGVLGYVSQYVVFQEVRVGVEIRFHLTLADGHPAGASVW